MSVLVGLLLVQGQDRQLQKYSINMYSKKTVSTISSHLWMEVRRQEHWPIVWLVLLLLPTTSGDRDRDENRRDRDENRKGGGEEGYLEDVSDGMLIGCINKASEGMLKSVLNHASSSRGTWA